MIWRGVKAGCTNPTIDANARWAVEVRNASPQTSCTTILHHFLLPFSAFSCYRSGDVASFLPSHLSLSTSPCPCLSLAPSLPHALQLSV